MLTASSLIAELDASLAAAPADWRPGVLRRIVDLFVNDAERYDDEQIGLFDDVICRLMTNIERLSLVELSNRLAGVTKAPVKAVVTLARNRDPAINGPILVNSATLPDRELAEIAAAEQAGIDVLTKIAARASLGEAVTDVLLKRGDAQIRRAIIANSDARISESGYARLVAGLNGDKALAAAVAARKDVPAELKPFLNATLQA